MRNLILGLLLLTPSITNAAISQNKFLGGMTILDGNFTSISDLNIQIASDRWVAGLSLSNSIEINNLGIAPFTEIKSSNLAVDNLIDVKIQGEGGIFSLSNNTFNFIDLQIDNAIFNIRNSGDATVIDVENALYNDSSGNPSYSGNARTITANDGTTVNIEAATPGQVTIGNSSDTKIVLNDTGGNKSIVLNSSNTTSITAGGGLVLNTTNVNPVTVSNSIEVGETITGQSLNLLSGSDRDIRVKQSLSGAGNGLNIYAGASQTGSGNDGGALSIWSGPGDGAGKYGNMIISTGTGSSDFGFLVMQLDLMKDKAGNSLLNLSNRQFFDTSNNLSINFENRSLVASDGSTDQINYGTAGQVNINAILKLPVQAAASTPTCGAPEDGNVALTNAHVMCVCNGSNWVDVATALVTCTF